MMFLALLTSFRHCRGHHLPFFQVLLPRILLKKIQNIHALAYGPGNATDSAATFKLYRYAGTKATTKKWNEKGTKTVRRYKQKLKKTA